MRATPPRRKGGAKLANSNDLNHSRRAGEGKALREREREQERESYFLGTAS